MDYFTNSHLQIVLFNKIGCSVAAGLEKSLMLSEEWVGVDQVEHSIFLDEGASWLFFGLDNGEVVDVSVNWVELLNQISIIWEISLG